MKNLLKKGTRCLIVQSKFSEFSFWNYVDVCKIAGAKYPAAPLGLMTVAALLPQQWEFKLIDENVEPLLDEYFDWADIVCTGGMLPQQQGILSVIDKAHLHGCPVVAGGPDPTSQPEFYRTADFLVLGEGEVTIPEFIKDLEKGSTGGEYKSEKRADMTNAAVPRFDLIKFKDYLQIGMQYSRGCPFNCEFCDIIELYGRKARTKTQEQILKELESLFELGYRGHIDFVDDNFIGNKKTVKTVLTAVREWSKAHNYPFYFSTEASMNLADDDELLQLMKDVDFRFVFLGIETPDEDVLKSINKKININKSITDVVNKISSYGMVVNAGCIIGFDKENEKTAENMKKCIQDSGIVMAMVGKLYALPNTQLTKRLKEEGRLLENGSTLRDTNTQIDQMSSSLNFITSRSRADVLRDYIHVVKYIYKPRNYYERVIHTGLMLKPSNKYKPDFVRGLKTMGSFLKLCLRVGFNRTTGLLYWKMLFTVLLKNSKGIEAAVNLAAMFVHFSKQAQFIIELTNREIDSIESLGEDEYYKSMINSLKK